MNYFISVLNLFECHHQALDSSTPLPMISADLNILVSDTSLPIPTISSLMITGSIRMQPHGKIDVVRL